MLVNNAGIYGPKGYIEKINWNEWVKAIQINLFGSILLCRAVIPYFISLEDTGVFPITDKRMTRFMITVEQGGELVWHVFNDMIGGEIYVKKIPSMVSFLKNKKAYT